MYRTCPCCGENGVSIYRLANSNPARPVQCWYCSKLFFLPNSLRNLLEVLFNFLTPLVFVAAFFLVSWLPVVLLVVSEYFAYFLSAVFGKPIVTDVADVAKSKSYLQLVRLIVLVVVIGAVIYANR